MSTLVLPRLDNENSPMDTKRIDRAIQDIYETLNGGLTKDALSRSYKIPVASFLEDRHVLSFRAQATGQAAGTKIMAGIIPTADANLLGIGWSLVVTAGIGNARTINVYTSTTLRIAVEVPSTNFREAVLPDGARIIHGFYVPDYQTVYGANSVLSTNWTLFGSETLRGSVSLFFTGVHV